MANEYCTLAALKAALTISDEEVDDALDRVRESASRAVDNFCGRRFYLDADASARTYTFSRRVVGDEDGDLFLVDDIGDDIDLLVEVGSAAAGWTDVTAEVELTPDNALPGRAVEALRRPYWTGARATRVRVTARWGWPAVPPQVAEAALLLAARLYKRKDSPEGVMGSSEWGVIRVSRMDPDVASLLAPYAKLGAA